MKIVGVMPVRNEAWCLGLTARVALKWVDELVIGYHDCTDRSEEIVRSIHVEGSAVIPIVLPSGPWDEMQHRQRLLNAARGRGATHVAIIDADELLTGSGLPEMRQAFLGIPAGAIAHLPGYNLRGGIQKYHANGIWGNRWFSTVFRDLPELSWSGDNFHSREPGGRKLNPVRLFPQGGPGVMHLWGASERRLIAKHALYKVTERLRWPLKPVAEIERMYNWAIKGDPSNHAYGTPATWTYAPVWDGWWQPYADLMKYLDVDAEPWQEEEVRMVLRTHGREMFAGLDLFGIA